MSKSDEMTYRSAGVDIEAGYEAVKRIKKHTERTTRPGSLGSIGSFGGAFEIPAGFKQPVLISGTDGVGTKIKLAFMTGKHDTIGIDAVAYCVNDIICQGAEPLYFLDYLAVGKLYVETVEQIVKGIADGCVEAGCALIGGETAEMPGIYAPEEYDLAGFAVGIVEKSDIVDGSRVAPGDVIIGIASTGLQSSGFSLVRKVCFEKAGLQVDDYIEDLGATVGETLLTPTGIYVKPMMELIKQCDVRGIANISGGGLEENVPRAMHTGVDAIIDRTSWEVPEVFRWLQQLGDIEPEEMWRTFNMGVGMSVIVSEQEADKALDIIARHGWDSTVIGRVQAGEGALILN